MKNNNIYHSKPKQPFIPKNSAPKKKVKRNLLFYVLIFAFFFWTIGSTLGLVTFIRSKSNNKDLFVAKADTVTEETTYSFEGSNLMAAALVTQVNTVEGFRQGFYNFNFKVSFSVTNDLFTITDSDFWIYVPTFNERAVKGSLGNTTYTLLNTSQARGTTIDFKAGGVTRLRINLGINFSGYFNGNVARIVVNSTNPTNTSTGNYDFHNMVSYFDTNGNYVRFSWYLPNDVEEYQIYSKISKFEERTYYVSGAYTDDEIYKLGYDAGKADGLSDNQSDIYYQGFLQGKEEGELLGYNNGIADSTNNSFANLLYSVVDAPVRVIRESLNFNLLGTNLSNLFFGFLTCALIIMVIKFFL